VNGLPDSPLASWDNFYVIVGSSGAALIGVQFVVVTLVAGLRRRVDPETLHAYATPTLVHLAGALLISALMTAPWHALASRALALGISGLAGLVYSVVVVRRARRQSGYKPVWEDWLWYAILPTGAWAALAAAALLLQVAARPAAFTVGGAALALLFVGIHNAWDTVTHVIVTRGDGRTHEDT
jgi:hypothetical protein